MNRRRREHLKSFAARTLIVKTLVLSAFVADPASLLYNLSAKLTWPETVASAQDGTAENLSEVYADLERNGLKENAYRQLAYMMIQEYLPPGARFTSGYRSPQKQLDLILRFARELSIPTQSNPTVENEASWMQTLMAVRAKGIIIAAPTTTPHGTDEAVFDLSGAELSKIEAGLEAAKKAKMVVFKRIIREPRNNAIHVEIEYISPKAFKALGKRGSPTSQGQIPADQGSGPPSADEQRRGMLRQLQNLHDIEPQTAKRIDYDRSMRNLLDPAADAERIKALDDEIRQHQKDAQDLAKENLVKAAYDRISEALNDDRYEDAEREAQSFAKKFPKHRQAQSMLKQVRMRRLISEAQDALYASDEPGCGECQKANELITEALNLYPNHEGALSIKDEVDACLEPCTSKRLLVVVMLGILTFVLAASGIGFFLLSRSGASPAAEGFKAPAWITEKVRGTRGWVLEVIEGAGRGQTFALDKEKIVVGSQGPPNGTADVVICDAERKISRQHCVIMHNGKQFYLLDESTNGTKINGHEVQRGVVAEFRSGDQITLADVAVLLLKPQ